ncbi:MAG: hypothetical protein JXQ93_03250 [Flavobacteriaceae bacterium]
MKEKYIANKNKEIKKKLEKPFKGGKNPFVYSSSKVSKLKRIVIPSLEGLYLDKLNFVSISLPKIHPMTFQKNEEEYPHEKIICMYDRDFSDMLLDQFKKSLDCAINDFKANIICINELGMPINKKGEVREDAILYARKMANENNCLIIAGSNHSSKTYLNIGYIFFPGVDLLGNDYRKFYKNISAVGVGEKLFTPSERIIYYTKAFGIGISFLICLEIADFSSSCTIVRRNESIDFLIVPTYLTDFGTMDKVSKSLSTALGGVLLSNCHNHKDLPDSRMYLHGNLHKDNQKEYTLKVIDDKTTVILRTVDMKKFGINKTKMALNLPEDLQFLFGPEMCEIG